MPKPAKPPRKPAPPVEDSPEAPAVVAFMAKLEHPLKSEIAEIRRLILAADPSIREGIKWNAPSFRTDEYFATFNLRTRDRARMVLHTGAKVRDTAIDAAKIPDPAALLEWLAKDRALVTLHDAADVQARGPALQEIIRAWVRWLV